VLARTGSSTASDDTCFLPMVLCAESNWILRCWTQDGTHGAFLDPESSANQLRAKHANQSVDFTCTLTPHLDETPLFEISCLPVYEQRDT
jgi:hypothetical protein